MWIRAQDKRRYVNSYLLTSIYVQYTPSMQLYEIVATIVTKEYYILGSYLNNEQAQSVMDDLEKALSGHPCGADNLKSGVFIMPHSEEVEKWLLSKKQSSTLSKEE